MHVAIVGGTGALGTLFARELSPVAAIAAIGRTTSLAGLANADVILVLVKTYDTDAALARIAPAIGATAIVVSLQNGIDAAGRVREALGPRTRIARAVTTESATRSLDGCVARGGIGVTVFADDGDADVPAALFASAGLAVERTAAFARAAWRKAAANAAINPLTALAGVANGELARDPALRARAATLAAEAIAVARCEGVELGDADTLVQTVVRATATNRSSMLQDLDAGRPTEIDALVGAVLRRAFAARIAVPELTAAFEAIRAREPRS